MKPSMLTIKAAVVTVLGAALFGSPPTVEARVLNECIWCETSCPANVSAFCIDRECPGDDGTCIEPHGGVDCHGEPGWAVVQCDFET